MTIGGWRKSSRSGSSGGNCVETRTHDGRCQVRDSKLGDSSPILGITDSEYTSLLTDIRAGRLGN